MPSHSGLSQRGLHFNIFQVPVFSLWFPFKQKGDGFPEAKARPRRQGGAGASLAGTIFRLRVAPQADARKPGGASSPMVGNWFCGCLGVISCVYIDMYEQLYIYTHMYTLFKKKPDILGGPPVLMHSQLADTYKDRLLEEIPKRFVSNCK